MTSVVFDAGQTVTVVTKNVTGADAAGNDVTTEAFTDYKNCAVWPGASTEQVQGEDVVSDTITVAFPASATVGPIDEVVVAGLRYKVTGTPAAWKNPWTSWAPGTTVVATRVH